MKTTPGRLRALTIGAHNDAEIVFVMPDGSQVEIQSAQIQQPPAARKTKAGRVEITVPRRIVLRMKPAAEPVAVPA